MSTVKRVIGSQWRDLVMTQYSDSEKESYRRRNAYGTVVSVEDDGKEYPVICMHGGSMWLCAACADAIIAAHAKEVA